MTTRSHILASGPGWRVDDVVCSAGPHDRPFEEQHAGVCIAAVMEGTFQYRTVQGAALLAPGAVLLGNDGQCFECGHEHGTGDRCLSFRFTPAFLEAATGEGARPGRPLFGRSHLPPLPKLASFFAAAEAARDDADPVALEELAVDLAGAVHVAAVARRRRARVPSPRDERRVTQALRRIEAAAHEPLTLSALARTAAMSPYHFLRVFRSVVGMTPHQYVLRMRLHRAAVRLIRSDDAVSAVAFEAGFGDLSTFNRRFRRITGLSPSAYRARGRVGGAGAVTAR